jgi:hypothetical protein
MDPVILDNLNRSVGGIITSLQDLQSAIASATTGSAKSVGADKKGPENSIGELEKIMQSFVKDFKETAVEQKKYMEDIVNSMKSVNSERSANSSAKKEAAPTAGGSDSQDESKNKKEEMSEQRRIRLEKLQKKMKNVSKEEIGIMEKALSSLKERGQISIAEYEQASDLNEEQMKLVKENMRLIKIYGASNLEEAKALDLISKKAKALQGFARQIGEIKSVFSSMEGALGIKAMETLTGGLVEQEIKYTREIRAAAYETDGLTKSSHGLQRAYEDIGTTVSSTGADRTKFQESYLKALKSGVKDLSLARDITKSQLNTEIQLGMEAGSLQDTFQSFAQTGRMTKGQISDMGRGMREVAKNTGLTGEALKGAIESSREIVNQLRNAASLTSMAAKNVIELSANAKKLGVDQQMQTLQSGLTSGGKLLMESSQQTQTMIFMAAGKVGKMNEAMNGTLLKTKEGVKSLGKGLEGILRDFGVGSLEEIDNLSDEAKTRLNISLKSVVGMELGEFRSLIESVNESGKGLGDRLEDINKKMKANITTDERKALMEEQRKLKASKQLEMLTALDEAAKGAKDMNGALAKFGERKKDFEGDLKSLGSSWQDSTQVAKDALKGAIESVNVGLKDAGKDELKIDASEIEKALKDPAALRELTAKIADGDQKIATAQKAQLDPVTQTNQTLSEINDSMRNLSQNIISKGFNSVVGRGLVTFVVLGTIAASIAGIVIQAVEIKKLVKKIAMGASEAESGYTGGEESLVGNIKGIFGKFFGKKEAAAGAAGPAGLAGAGGPAGLAGAAPKPPETPKPTVPTPAVAPLTPAVPPPTPVTPSPANQKPSAESMSMVEKMGQKPSTAEPAANAAGPTTPAPKAEKSIKIFQDILAALELMTDRVDVAANRLSEIIKCICKAAATPPSTPSPTPAASTAAATPPSTPSPTPAASTAAAAPPSVPQDVQKQQTKNVIDDTKRGKQENLNLKNNTKITKEQNALVGAQKEINKKEDSVIAASKGPPEASVLDPASLMEGGQAMMKTAAAIALMVAGAMAIAVVLFFVGSKVLSALGLDLGKVVEVASTIAAIVGATLALIMAGAAAHKAIDENKESIDKMKGGGASMLQAAMTIVPMSLILVLLGAAIIFVVNKILSIMKIDASKAIEIGMTIGAIAGVVGAIAVATAHFIEFLEELEGNKMWQNLKNNPAKFIVLIAKASIALLLLAPAIVLIGAAIIMFSQYILAATGINASTALKVGATIAAIMLSVGLIALALIGSLAGLAALGYLTEWLLTPAPGPVPLPPAVLMLIGAEVLLKLGPPILLLGTALMFFGKIVLGAAGIDASTAMKIGMAISAIFVAVGLISVALGAAMVGLTALGFITAVILGSPLIGLMEIGYLALLIIGPRMLLLGTAIVFLSKMLFSITGLNLASIAKTTLIIYALFAGVALISAALSVAMIGLAALGLITAIIFGTGLPALMDIGASALLIFTPAMLLLASAIIWMGILVSKFIVTPKQAGETALAIASILGAAALIGAAIVAMATVSVFLGAIGLISPIIAVAMLPAAAGLHILAIPMVEFVQAAVIIAKNLSGAMPLNKVNECVSSIASILGAALIIATMLIGFAAIGVNLGAIAFITPFIAIAMLPAAAGLRILAIPMVEFAQATAIVAKNLSGALPPAQVEEAVNAVTTILNGAAKIGLAIVGMIPTMMYMSMIGTFSPLIALSMSGAGVALIVLSQPLAFFAFAAKYVAVLLNSIMTPKDAEEAEKAVTSILNGAAHISDSMMGMIPKLMNLGATVPSMWIIAPIMSLAATALYMMAKPVFDYANAIVFFATVLAMIIPPDKVKSLSEGVTTMLRAISEISDEFQKIRDKIVSIGMGEGVFKLFLFTLPALRMGVKAFNEMKYPIFDFIMSIVGFTNALSIVVTPSVAKTATKTINATSEIIAKVSDIMSNLNSKIVPMTTAGWFTKSPVDILMEAKNKLATFFPAMFDLIKSIVTEVQSKFEGTGKLKSTAKTLVLIGVIIDEVSKAINSLGTNIAPFVEKGWWSGKSVVDKITEAKPELEKFIKSIADLIGSGIVGPIAKMENVEELKKAAKAMAAISVLMSETSTAIKSLAETVGMMDGKLFKASPIAKIMADKDLFGYYFYSIAEFITDGIVGPIMDVIPDGSTLKSASAIMTSVSKVCSETAITIKSLSEVMKLMDPVSLFDRKSPMQKIVENKKLFSSWFFSIGLFVKNGIVEPVITIFDDTTELLSATKIISSMATIATSIVPMIKNLATAIALATDGKTWFDKAPMQKIIEGKELFSKWFFEIGLFVRDGIVIPTLEVMDGINIGAATKIIVSMAQIAASITPMIKNLAGALGMMSQEGGGTIDTEFPLDRIMASKDKFRGFFRETAQFMKEGIIDPIIEEIPDPKNIQIAWRIMSAMNALVIIIPQVIKNFANGLIPLVDCPDKDLKSIPANRIEANKQKFRDFFLSTTKFMKEGIVDPILENMPDAKNVQEAAKILIANNQLLTNLKSVITNLASLFEGFSPKKSFSKAPIAIISKMAPIFSIWFYSVAEFITEGIVDPILVFFPSSDEVEEASVRLENLVKVIRMVPGFLVNLGTALQELLPTVLWLQFTGVGFGAMIFSSIFGGIASTLNYGIIEPISKMPDKEGLDRVVGTINGLADVVDAASDSMKRMGATFNDFGIITGVFSAIFGRWDQTYFQKSFMNMANSLNYGLIQPILKFMPKKSELDMVVDQLNGLITILDKVKDAMISVSDTMDSIGGLGLDFNTINALPIDKLAALAQVSQKGVSAAGGSISSTVKPEVEVNTSSIPPMSLADNLGSRVAAKKAGDKPASSIVSSKELSDISESSEKQTQLTEELVEMFKQFMTMMKAGSANSSGGGEEACTGLNRVRGKNPPKFFKSTTGQVSRGPGKQALNMGPPGP